MSTIARNPVDATRPARSARRQELKTVLAQLTEKPARLSDQEMMYAWSIEATSASKKPENQGHEETCPPEVYIG